MFDIGEMVSWCTICGRELNRHGVCINLFCQQQAAAMPQARGYVSEVDHEAGRVTVSAGRRVEQVLRCTGCPYCGCRPCTGYAGHMRAQCTSSQDTRCDACANRPRARVARTRPRRIWRGVDGGQSVVMLQVMGEMWGSRQRWGDAPDPTRS